MEYDTDSRSNIIISYSRISDNKVVLFNHTLLWVYWIVNVVALVVCLSASSTISEHSS